jgi:hypothetical protein
VIKALMRREANLPVVLDKIQILAEIHFPIELPVKQVGTQSVHRKL